MKVVVSGKAKKPSGCGCSWDVLSVQSLSVGNAPWAHGLRIFLLYHKRRKCLLNGAPFSLRGDLCVFFKNIPSDLIGWMPASSFFYFLIGFQNAFRLNKKKLWVNCATARLSRARLLTYGRPPVVAGMRHAKVSISFVHQWVKFFINRVQLFKMTLLLLANFRNPLKIT